jgi:hypothetical protein
MNNAITARLASLSIEEIANVINGLMNDTRAETDVVMSAALNALESKMPEADFLRFCEKLG